MKSIKKVNKVYGFFAVYGVSGIYEGSTVDTVNEYMKSTGSIRSTGFAGSMGWKSTSQKGHRSLWGSTVDTVNESMKSSGSIRSTGFAGLWVVYESTGSTRSMKSISSRGSMRSTRSTVDIHCFDFTHELCHCLYFQQRNSWNIWILNYIRKIKKKINPELSEIFWYIIQIFECCQIYDLCQSRQKKFRNFFFRIFSWALTLAELGGGAKCPPGF